MARKEYGNLEIVETRLYLEHPYKRGVFVPIRRRPLRLAGCDYSSPNCLCFVTCNVHPKCGVRFIDKHAELAWEWMWQQFEIISCEVFAACIMPDHLHALLAPSGKGESISDVVQRVKTIIGTALRREHAVYLKWQASFYDHILRGHENRADEYDAIVNYIYDNPVKAGYGDDYPYRYRAT